MPTPFKVFLKHSVKKSFIMNKLLLCWILVVILSECYKNYEIKEDATRIKSLKIL